MNAPDGTEGRTVQPEGEPLGLGREPQRRGGLPYVRA